MAKKTKTAAKNGKRLTRRERAQIVRNVTVHGWSVAEAAARAGVVWTTVRYHVRKAQEAA